MNNLGYAASYHGNIVLKLDNMLKLLEELGNPEKDLNFVHVAGTNGKGSVCAFLEEMLVKEGIKTGRFSSPELVKRNESIRVDKKDISDDELEEVLKTVHRAAEKLEKFPSPYEVLLGAAFVYFRKCGCELVVCEAGMGGDGDATNVIKNCRLAIITPISKDHTAYLGETEEEIARVKSGIIKPGCVFLTAEKNKPYFDIFKEKCNEINIAEPFDSVGFEEIYEIISYCGREIKLSLGGIMQLENAALAVKASELLGVGEESIIYGLENTKNPARTEKIKENVYFDGAHNPDGAMALKKSLERYMKDCKKTFVMGVMKDKDFSSMLDILNEKDAKFLFTTVKGNKRAMKAEDMVKVAKDKGINAEAVSSPLEGIRKGYGKIIICGSLYMYKEIL